MAFFSVNNEQCRTLWVNNVGVVDPLPADVPSWRVLPTDYESLCERITVDGFGYINRQALFSHPVLEAEGRSVALALRVQGLVADVKINTTGNWNGQLDAAPRATQWITLTGGGNNAAFRPQREGIANIEEIIRSMVGGNLSHHHPKDGTVKLQRRVFTKVRADVNVTPVTVTKQDDPEGRVAKIAKEWVVDHRMRTWVKKTEGGLEPVNPYAIRRGDLVDVLVIVEIVTMRGKGGQRVEVHFAPQEIVRLESAARLRVLSKRSDAAADSTVLTARKQHTVESFGVQANIVAGVEEMEI